MKEKILALLNKTTLSLMPDAADALASLIDREFIVQERPKRFKISRVAGPGFEPRDHYGFPHNKPPESVYYFYDREKSRTGERPPMNAVFYDRETAFSFWLLLPEAQREAFPY